MSPDSSKDQGSTLGRPPHKVWFWMLKPNQVIYLDLNRLWLEKSDHIVYIAFFLIFLIIFWRDIGLKRSVTITISMVLAGSILQSCAVKEAVKEPVGYNQCLEQYEAILDGYGSVGAHPACLIVEWNQHCKAEFIDIEKGYESSLFDAYNRLCGGALIVSARQTMKTIRYRAKKQNSGG